MRKPPASTSDHSRPSDASDLHVWRLGDLHVWRLDLHASCYTSWTRLTKAVRGERRFLPFAT